MNYILKEKNKEKNDVEIIFTQKLPLNFTNNERNGTPHN